MGINNGQERLDNIREAMHREIDSFMDKGEKSSISEFTIMFDCGVDRVLTMNIVADRILKDKNGISICMPMRIEGDNDNE